MDVLYFAWVRERIGMPRERIETTAPTVMALITELMAREERYARRHFVGAEDAQVPESR